MAKQQDPSRAEMPFLEHLEELRWRILWSLLALVVGSMIGFWVVQHYDVLSLLKRPIAPLLPDGKLYITRPTDAFVITLKLAVLVGAVLAAPVITWPVWGFLSPALYKREKRFLVPALLAGLLLFLGGALMAYLWILPTALHLLFTFQRPDLAFIITAEEYFSFASLLILAFGLVFEMPLVIVLLAAFGIVDPRFFARHRPIALVLGAGLADGFNPCAFALLVLFATYTLTLVNAVSSDGRPTAAAQRKAGHAAGSPPNDRIPDPSAPPPAPRGAPPRRPALKFRLHFPFIIYSDPRA